MPPEEAVSLHVFGVRISIIVPATATGGAFSLFEETTPPRVGPPLHIHHGEEEFFRIVEGHYRFRVGEEEIDAEPGHTLLVPRGTLHTFFNMSEESGRLFMGFSPGGAETFFVQVAAQNLVVPADMGQIGALGLEHNLEFVGSNPFLDS